jgi:cell division protease FtsH
LGFSRARINLARIVLFKSLRKYRNTLKWTGIALALAASLALVWFTLHTPEQGRNALATAMEKDSAGYFATERDINALAQDAQTGAAKAIGLSPQYALVNLRTGGRYYVRIDGQRALISDLLKDKLAPAASHTPPAVFTLGDVQPPATPLTALGRAMNPGYLSLLGPLLILYLMLQMGPLRSNGLFKNADQPDTRFDDVVGVADAKEALEDIVAYLKNPRRFSELGAKPPKGVVLEGHFGAGKTLLARALAGEARVPFISISGSDFSDMFLGVGVRRVKKLFAMARRQAPCVIFIDEIDGLGKRSSATSSGETENNRIINTLLVELDGFSAQSGIVVLGATNNVANLDPALVRPGRFDRTCHVGLPNVDEREALFRLYAGKLRTAGATDFRQLARVSTGLSPAAVANVMNAAALLAAKEEAAAVTEAHFQRSLEQHLMGGPVAHRQASSDAEDGTAAGRAALNRAEAERIAVHEAGHAIVAGLLGVGVVEKVSILKRGRALGVTLVTQHQDITLQSEPELRARMAMLLAGRGAEMLVLGNASTGAANDLEHVSGMAYRMVTEFGFGRGGAPFSYAGLPEHLREAAAGPETVAEARDIIREVEARCQALLVANRAALNQLAAELLEHETVSGAVVERCLAQEQPQAEAA